MHTINLDLKEFIKWRQNLNLEIKILRIRIILIITVDRVIC